MDVNGGIDADSINVKELNTPSTGAINMIPIAIGRCAAGGVTVNATPNLMVTKTSTGVYQIKLGTYVFDTNKNVVLVTPDNTGVRHATYNISSGILKVHIVNGVNGAQDTPFSIIIYEL